MYVLTFYSILDNMGIAYDYTSFLKKNVQNIFKNPTTFFSNRNPSNTTDASMNPSQESLQNNTLDSGTHSEFLSRQSSIEGHSKFDRFRASSADQDSNSFDVASSSPSFSHNSHYFDSNQYTTTDSDDDRDS